MNSIAKGLLLLSFVTSLGGVSNVHAIAGKIVYSYGQVEATSVDGTIRDLARGDIIESGEAIRTINGRTQIRFTDGGFVALQPNTQYRLEDYNFEGSVDGSEKSFFYLVEGSIRLVTGLIGRSNKENFQLTTPVASIGIRGTSGKCTHTETGGTQLAGYGGIWNLTSGAFSGPVEPGQAYSCNGSTCAEIPGFGQRQDTASENQEEQEEEEEEEEEEEQEEEQSGEDEGGEDEGGEGQTDSEGEEETTLLADSENEESEEGLTLNESDNEEEGLSITSSNEEETGFVANREDEGGEEAFFEIIVEGQELGLGAPDEPTALELVIGESTDSNSELGLGAFAQGEQTDTDGQFTILTAESTQVSNASSSSVTFLNGQTIGVSGTESAVLSFGSFSENIEIPTPFAVNNAAIFFRDDAPAGALARDVFFGREFLGFFIADFEAVRLGLIKMRALDSELSEAGLSALNAIDNNTISQLSSNPAEFILDGTTPDGFLSFGRWQNGFVLDIDASPSGTIRSSKLRELVGFQAEHIVNGISTTPTSNTLARYDLNGTTLSTSSLSSDIGLGLTSGQILFDLSVGYGSIEATLSHASITHQLFGDLVLTNSSFVGSNGIAINSLGSPHRVDFIGFFSGNNAATPEAIGLNYGVHTSNPIIGAATFGLTSTGVSNLRNAETGSFVGVSHAMRTTSISLDSDAYIFRVNGTNTLAKLSGNIINSFITDEPGDRCSQNCAFDRGTASVTIDSTGPSTSDPRTGTTIPGWSNTELGVNWARFGSGYTLSQDNLNGKVGSAHLITFKNSTPVAEIPTSGTATYNAIRGGTHPTATFISNGVVQPEVVGALTQAQVTIDFGTRAVNTNLQGVFPDGGNGGSFQLTGSGTGSFGSAGGLTAFNLVGGVTSARISDNAGNNCAGGCNLSGRTDQILVGQFARALGGSFHGNAPGTFSVNGTYLLEQSANLALQPTVSISSPDGSTN